MNEIVDAQRELIEEFQFLDNWMDRYQYIIDLGRRLPDFPEEWRHDEFRLRGCQSQVWLKAEKNADRLRFAAISDSAIVSGLIAMLLRVYSDREPAQIVATPPDFVAAIGLDEHLSPTRSNGLNAMIQAMKAAATDALAA